MALKKTVKLKNSNIDIPDAYCRIKALRFDHPDTLWVQVGVYENETGPLLDAKEYTFTVEQFGGKDKISAATAYALLKAKEEWAGAEDI